MRALQTLQWVNQDGPRVDREAVFDHDHITQKLGRIDREEEVWEALFDRHAIVPYRVVYEDFVEAQEETVRGVLDALGVDDVPADLHLPPPVLDRQADEVTDAWVERYLAEVAP